jgi:hypothetical protein
MPNLRLLDTQFLCFSKQHNCLSLMEICLLTVFLSRVELNLQVVAFWDVLKIVIPFLLQSVYWALNGRCCKEGYECPSVSGCQHK